MDIAFLAAKITLRMRHVARQNLPQPGRHLRIGLPSKVSHGPVRLQ
jgi:hypothetical protein